MNALQNIATEIGFFNCTTNQISAKSPTNDTVNFVFDDNLNEKTNDELGDLLSDVFYTIRELYTNHLTQEVSLKYDDGYLNLAVKLVGGGEIQYEDAFNINDVTEIIEALDELTTAEDDMNEMKGNIEGEINGVLRSLYKMPPKGLKSNEYQKTHISNILDDLSNAANSASLTDFLSNWEEL